MPTQAIPCCLTTLVDTTATRSFSIRRHDMQTHDSLDVAQPVRIMALGDSVTVMLPDQNYRERLAASCRAVGYNVNFVGAIGVDKLTTLTSRHSAISGITAAEVDTHYIDSWMDLAEPDIVLMLLGANDIQ